VIHQTVFMVSQCCAGAWLNGMGSGDQRRLMGSGSASEACSRTMRYTNLPPFTLLLYYKFHTFLKVKVKVKVSGFI